MRSKLLEQEGRSGRKTDRAGPVIAAARVQDGNTVLRFADRSTITFFGIARLDQLTLFSGDRLRTIRRVV